MGPPSSLVPPLGTNPAVVHTVVAAAAAAAFFTCSDRVGERAHEGIRPGRQRRAIVQEMIPLFSGVRD